MDERMQFEEGFLAAWADITAGAMMKEKLRPTSFGMGWWRVACGKCRVTSGGEKKEEEGFIARTRRFLHSFKPSGSRVTIWSKGASK